MRISDEITAYILHMLECAEDGEAELRRNELAETLGCVPSQITMCYITFTPAGYVIESGGKRRYYGYEEKNSPG